MIHSYLSCAAFYARILFIRFLIKMMRLRSHPDANRMHARFILFLVRIARCFPVTGNQTFTKERMFCMVITKPPAIRSNGGRPGMKKRSMFWKGKKAVFRCGILFLFLLLLSKAIAYAGDASSIQIFLKEGKEGIRSIQRAIQSPNGSGAPTKNSIVKPEEDKDSKAERDGEDGNWMLTLVNGENPLPDEYSPPLEKLENGLQFDARAIDQLNAMLSDARAQGLSPVVCSAYRTIEYQEKLFDNQINKQMSRGWGRRQAVEEASKVVSYPGTSEHNLGLAADIVSESYQILDEKQADTSEMQWLLEHCSEYGFILRYPEGKTDVTGVIYEPWHFRYVGKQAAKEITENGLCLEEYLMNH